MRTGSRLIVWGVRLLRPLVWLWPRPLRSVARERDLVLAEVLEGAYRERGLGGLVARWAWEGADALRVGVGGRPGVAGSALVTAALLGAVLLPRSGPVVPGAEVVVRASDPAGEFTLTLQGGRLVAASVDRVAYPADRLVQTADSLRVLDAAGRAVVAVAFEAPGTIRWEPRDGVGP